MESLPTLEPENEWIYVNPSAWDSNPLSVDYYFIPERWVWALPEDEVFTDDEDMEMPREVEGLGLVTFKTIFDLKHLLTQIPEPDDAQALVALIRERAEDRAGWAKRIY